MAKIPIGLQLYSIREDCKRDLPGTLAAVAKMGYDGVEFAGYYDRTAKELRGMLDDLGLPCCGSHIALGVLLGDELQKTIDFCLELGNRFLVMPGLPKDKRETLAGWRETAEICNEVAEKLKPHGMQVGYHNHHFEFKEIEGGVPWDTFFGSTVPEVIMQLDTGNALHGGFDPVAQLKKYPGRATTIHLKEYSATNDKALVGDGDTEWDEIFKLCEEGGTQWYIVEQESYAHSPLECVKKCVQNLRKMGK